MSGRVQVYKKDFQWFIGDSLVVIIGHKHIISGGQESITLVPFETSQTLVREHSNKFEENLEKKFSD